MVMRIDRMLKRCDVVRRMMKISRFNKMVRGCDKLRRKMKWRVSVKE